MNAARRNHKRRDWPRGLYEPKPSYFIWRSKITGKAFALGKITLTAAKAEAAAANAHEAGEAPKLVERLTSSTSTVADILGNMKDRPSAASTIRMRKCLDKYIRDALGDKQCRALTVADCAKLIEGIADEGKARMSEAVRTRLIQVCRRGQQLGWLSTNPAEVTRNDRAKVKRGRLTMETFWKIHEKAPEVATWLQRAMMIGLVLGADRMTIAGLQRSNVANGLLTYQRQKTKAVIAVPLALRLDVAGVSLAELVAERGRVLSRHLLHHTVARGMAKLGAPIHPDTMSQAFTDARKLAGIPDEGAPTFHELRSLCRRSYAAQGNVDVKALLGHSGERVSELYQDARGAEPIFVKVG